MARFPTLTISQFDEYGTEHELYVNAVSEHLHRHHAHISLPHGHDFYLTVLFTHGTGFHEVDFQRYDVRPGSVFFLHPGQTHHWEFSDDIEGCIFFHSSDWFRLNFPHQPIARFPFFFSRLNTPHLQLPAAMLPVISAQFNTLLSEFRSSLPYRHQKIASLVHCLYIDLSREYDAHHPQKLSDLGRYADAFRRFEALVDRWYVSEKSAAFYAAELNIGTKHLNRISRENIGKTSTEVILGRVMLEARRLLSEGQKNLNEIALQLGYEEYAYFSRLFRQYCGESPRTFRKRYH